MNTQLTMNAFINNLFWQFLFVPFYIDSTDDDNPLTFHTFIERNYFRPQHQIEFCAAFSAPSQITQHAQSLEKLATADVLGLARLFRAACRSSSYPSICYQHPSHLSIYLSNYLSVYLSIYTPRIPRPGFLANAQTHKRPNLGNFLATVTASEKYFAKVRKTRARLLINNYQSIHD